MDINARLEKLERENRRMKKIGIVAIVFTSVLFISGQAKTNEVVEANEVRVMVASGKIRAKLFSINGPQLQFYDEAGTPLVTLSGASVGPTMLSMFGSGGNLLINVDDLRGPSVTVRDQEGYAGVLGRSELVVTKTGRKEQTPAASLVLFDKDKKVLWSAP